MGENSNKFFAGTHKRKSSIIIMRSACLTTVPLTENITFSEYHTKLYYRKDYSRKKLYNIKKIKVSFCNFKLTAFHYCIVPITLHEAWSTTNYRNQLFDIRSATCINEWCDLPELDSFNSSPTVLRRVCFRRWFESYRKIVERKKELIT